MALNSELAIRRATGRILELLQPELHSAQITIETLKKERDIAQAHVVKLGAEAERYRLQAERYKAEAENLRGQLMKTKAKFTMTLVPVLDDSYDESRPKNDPNGFFNFSVGAKKKRKRFSTAITKPLLPSSSSNSLSTPKDGPFPAISSSPLRNEDPIPLKTSTLSLPNTQNTQNTPSRSPSRKNEVYDPFKRWCYCDNVEYGDMVACSSSNCPKEWFHIPCTGLEQVPEGDWLCNYCIGASSLIAAKPHARYLPS